jgi:hypothetical protein
MRRARSAVALSQLLVGSQATLRVRAHPQVMTHTDPRHERTAAVRRSRAASSGLVLGAALGSLGVAGVLGVSAAAHPPTSTAPDLSSQAGPTGSQSSHGLLPGDDDGELDDGLHWVPPPPSTQFGSGGSGGAVSAPHAQTAGS